MLQEAIIKIKKGKIKKKENIKKAFIKNEELKCLSSFFKNIL